MPLCYANRVRALAKNSLRRPPMSRHLRHSVASHRGAVSTAPRGGRCNSLSICRSSFVETRCVSATFICTFAISFRVGHTGFQADGSVTAAPSITHTGHLRPGALCSVVGTSNFRKDAYEAILSGHEAYPGRSPCRRHHSNDVRGIRFQGR